MPQRTRVDYSKVNGITINFESLVKGNTCFFPGNADYHQVLLYNIRQGNISFPPPPELRLRIVNERSNFWESWQETAVHTETPDSQLYMEGMVEPAMDPLQYEIATLATDIRGICRVL